MLGKDDIETAAKAPTITAAVTILRMRGIAASFGFPLPGNADIARICWADPPPMCRPSHTVDFIAPATYRATIGTGTDNGLCWSLDEHPVQKGNTARKVQHERLEAYRDKPAGRS
jgi:hypothetical protein